MRFCISVRSGGEVIFEGRSTQGRPVYYGVPLETGRWRIDIVKFERILSTEFAPLSFGDSIDEFLFAFEIAELDGWGTRFTSTREYVSYRPKRRQLVAVGQVEWEDVKHLPREQQFPFLSKALIAAIENVARVKRKPKYFDTAAFAVAARIALDKCAAAMVSPGSAQVARIHPSPTQSASGTDLP